MVKKVWKKIQFVLTIASLFCGVAGTVFGVFENLQRKRIERQITLTVGYDRVWTEGGVTFTEHQQVVLDKRSLEASKDSTIKKLLAELARKDVKTLMMVSRTEEPMEYMKALKSGFIETGKKDTLLKPLSETNDSL